MRCLHLCFVFPLCVLVCLDIARADTTEPTSLLNRAKGKVKDLISKVRPPSSSGNTSPAPASSGGTRDKVKETIKKVNTQENREKAKQAFKKLNTKQNREKAKKLLKKIPSWGIVVAVLGAVLVLGVAGGIIYKKRTKDNEGEAEVETEPEPDTTTEDV